ncbi:hypothetical protein U9M48_017615 [Paspalum notatum var. saurae]|uniref:Uncharacterized protein n=1 Tax=Paspalum notatum var. saurae TaxID=547442 RepID=A0AAQ3T872_PASNO
MQVAMARRTQQHSREWQHSPSTGNGEYLGSPKPSRVGLIYLARENLTPGCRIGHGEVEEAVWPRSPGAEGGLLFLHSTAASVGSATPNLWRGRQRGCRVGHGEAGWRCSPVLPATKRRGPGRAPLRGPEPAKVAGGGDAAPRVWR